ncbi:MAG TPA: SDR family oxidoreductase [Candidatus Saccharimonadales bacterium]|nr:SDR family oxidoreductase [Candidatus Saccharimonadales bacterium]
MSKTIIITGGSDGLGKALVEKLAPSNEVIILARNEATMRAIAKETGCRYYVCDVRDAKQVTSTFGKISEEHGKIDVLINSAGVIVNAELVDIPDETIENVITTNTLGTIYAAKAALIRMKQQKQGLIVNVVSTAGITAKATRSIYNASKWAITGFTKALQEEAAEYNVRVTGFYPGTIRTNLFAKAGLPLSGKALTTEQAVKAIEFVLSCDDNMLVPEIGIKPL